MLTLDLARLLAGYRPSDALEARHLDAFGALARAGARCFSRAHFVPGHVTTSAFVLDPSRERVGLIFHKKLACWLQPGGHVEASDVDLLASARREALEETGLGSLEALAPGIFDLDVHAIPARGEEPAHAHFDLRFAFASPTLDAQASEEVAGFQWVPLASFESGPAPSDESVLRAVRKLRDLR